MTTATNTIITIKYSTLVKVAAGWRDVNVVAKAAMVSKAMAEVVEVITIDGEEPSRTQSRTGAKHQESNGIWWSKTQIGAKKRVSACEVIEA